MKPYTEWDDMCKYPQAYELTEPQKVTLQDFPNQHEVCDLNVHSWRAQQWRENFEAYWLKQLDQYKSAENDEAELLLKKVLGI